MSDESIKRRVPAEWDSHAATWIAWPHYEPDWPGKLAVVQWLYAEIVRVLTQYERVEILCHNETVQAQAVDYLGRSHVDSSRYRTHIVPNDRSWLRDSAPTAVRTADGQIEWVCWRFNAWSKYDNYHRDEKVADAIAHISGMNSVEACRSNSTDRLVLEGGVFDTDGEGTLLVTEECLLSSEQVRNPGMSREDYEQAFAEYLGIKKVIWLGLGCIGDDTHGHVDDIARFVAPCKVVLAYEEDAADANHESSVDNLDHLKSARDAAGHSLEIIKLPYPRAVIMEGERLPASYANFYICNNAVLVPTFNDVNDREALDILADCFPDRDVIGIYAVDLVWGMGTLHCLTQQQPAD